MRAGGNAHGTTTYTTTEGHFAVYAVELLAGARVEFVQLDDVNVTEAEARDLARCLGLAADDAKRIREAMEQRDRCPAIHEPAGVRCKRAKHPRQAGSDLPSEHRADLPLAGGTVEVVW